MPHHQGSGGKAGQSSLPLAPSSHVCISLSLGSPLPVQLHVYDLGKDRKMVPAAMWKTQKEAPGSGWAQLQLLQLNGK